MRKIAHIIVEHPFLMFLAYWLLWMVWNGTSDTENGIAYTLRSAWFVLGYNVLRFLTGITLGFTWVTWMRRKWRHTQAPLGWFVMTLMVGCPTMFLTYLVNKHEQWSNWALFIHVLGGLSSSFLIGCILTMGHEKQLEPLLTWGRMKRNVDE